tara:strand:- start:349 stop:561 length:213 start_codon:yes stop_codon:yes gene_type:complete
MKNPFEINWAHGWTFQIVHVEGGSKIEGYGFGIRIQGALVPTESPLMAADRLVFNEDRKRKSLFNTWKSK